MTQHTVRQQVPRARTGRLHRTAAALAVSAAITLVAAGPALAHVTVNPDTAAPGSYSKLTFRVPNESATATTVKVEIGLPNDTPFASVRAKDTPGWTVEITRTQLDAPVTQGDITLDDAVTGIVFTADAGTEGIGVDKFAEFDISVGPVPDVPDILFTATQTYSDGSVVQWNEPATADGSEPEHPAPVLTVAGESADHHGAAAEESDTTGEVSVAAATEPAPNEPAAGDEVAAATDGADGTARILAATGIVVGGIGIAVGVFGLTRGRRTTT